MIEKEQLIAIGAEKLADILLSFCETNNDIKKQLNIIIAGTNEDSKKIIALIKKEISSLKRSTKFVDYFETSQLAERIDNLLSYITKDLMPKSPTQAVELMVNFLNLHESTLNHVDDSNGEVGGSFMLWCADLGKIYEEASISIEETVEFCFHISCKTDMAYLIK